MSKIFSQEPGYELRHTASGLRWHKTSNASLSDQLEQLDMLDDYEGEKIVVGDVNGAYHINSQDMLISAEDGSVDIYDKVSCTLFNATAENGGEVSAGNITVDKDIILYNSHAHDVEADRLELSDSVVEHVSGNANVRCATQAELNNVECYGTVMSVGGTMNNIMSEGTFITQRTEDHPAQVSHVNKGGQGILLVSGGKLTNSNINVSEDSKLIVNNVSMNNVNFSLPDGVVAGVNAPASLGDFLDASEGDVLLTEGMEPNTMGIITSDGKVSHVYHQAHINEDGSVYIESTRFLWKPSNKFSTQQHSQDVAEHLNNNVFSFSPCNDSAAERLNSLAQLHEM